MKFYKHIGTGDFNLEHISTLKAWEAIEESPTNQEFILTTKEKLTEKNYTKIAAILYGNHAEIAKKSRPI
jgi:hypothetical protein